MSLSLIMPSIRLPKIKATYESIKRSYSGELELIIISPFSQPKDLIQPDIVWIVDKGNMSRCKQLGLLASTKDVVGWACDDGLFVGGFLDMAMLFVKDDNYVSMKYTESENPAPETFTSEFWTAGYHEELKGLVPPDVVLMGFALIKRKLLLNIGGWDCRFEQLGESEVDIAVRLYNSGIKGLVTPWVCLQLEWMPGESGDHAPVHKAHFEHDLPLLKETYASNKNRTKIDLNNWQQAPDVWVRRFGKKIDITLMFPIRGNADLLHNLMNTLNRTTDNPGRIEILINIDQDDDEYDWETIQALELEYKDFNMKFRCCPRSDNFVEQYFNPMAKMAQGRWIMTINDDCGFITEGWDTKINDRMASYAKLYGDDFIYGITTDGENHKLFADNLPEFTSWCLLSKTFVEKMGYFFDKRCWVWGQDQVCGQLFYVVNQLTGQRRRIDLTDVVIKCNHKTGQKRENSPNWERFCRIHDEHNKVLYYGDLYPEALRVKHYIEDK